MVARRFCIVTAYVALVTFAFAISAVQAAATLPIDAGGVGGCQQTEYLAYRDCVHAVARRKRQSPAELVSSYADAHNTTESAANAKLIELPKLRCEHLNFGCRIACGNDTNCESLCPVCPLNVDDEGYAGGVVAGSGAAADLRTVVIENADGRNEQFQARIDAGRNITTIIRLTNILNNTNHVHIPTNVVANNVNTVNLHQNHTTGGASASETGGEFGLGHGADGSACCHVLRERNCRGSSTAGQRCHHSRRQRVCDANICKARTMHAQRRNMCSRSTGACRQKIVYVPEPGAHKCVRTESWPYVVCGTVVAGGNEANYWQQERTFQHQQQQQSPWGQGFWFQASPAMMPPPWMTQRRPDCHYTGGCGGGRSGSRHQQRPRDVYYEDEVPEVEGTSANGTETDGASGEWLTEDTKCKVVSANGTTVEIQNCTASVLEENEYAREPKVNLTEDVRDDEYDDDMRPKRQTGEHQRKRNNAMAADDDWNDVIDVDDDQYVQYLPSNRIADDFDYNDEYSHNRRKNRRHRNGKRRHGGKNNRRHQKQQRHKIVYDEE